MIQFVGFFGAHAFARVAGRVGAKNAIAISLVVWTLVVVESFVGMKSTRTFHGIEARHLEFWFLGGVIAVVLGGSQALSRSLFAQMVPREREAEFFGFYEISERSTSWLATLAFGLVNQRFHSLRLGILSIVFFLAAG